MAKSIRLGNGRNAPKLPKQQLTILALCRFAEPVAMTSVSQTNILEWATVNGETRETESLILLT